MDVYEMTGAWQDADVMRDACADAREWACAYPTIAEAWTACHRRDWIHRGDWMLWYAARVGVDCKLVGQAACACVRLVVPSISDDPRALAAIETAEAWARGGVELAGVLAAADAVAGAFEDAFAADGAAASAACVAAALAAQVAVAAFAPYAAAAVAPAVASAASTARPSVANERTLKRCADAVRTIISVPTVQQ